MWRKWMSPLNEERILMILLSDIYPPIKLIGLIVLKFWSVQEWSMKNKKGQYLHKHKLDLLLFTTKPYTKFQLNTSKHDENQERWRRYGRIAKFAICYSANKHLFIFVEKGAWPTLHFEPPKLGQRSFRSNKLLREKNR